MENIFAKEKKICEFEDNTWKVVAKIRKMYTHIIQKEFLSLKASKEWTSQDLWKYLKT